MSVSKNPDFSGFCVVEVDSDWNDAAGNDYHFVASKPAVKAGFMLNKSVIIRTPDGEIHFGNLVTITVSGLSKINEGKTL